MRFFRKHLVVILAIFFVYSIFFVTHLPTRKPVARVQGVVNNLVLFEQPTAGRSPLLSAIDNASSQIDVEVYLLSDKEIIQHLLDAKSRGVIVSVMLEQHPFGGGNINQKTEKVLRESGINIKWTSDAFSLTHEKCIIIDRQEALILNQNLTTSSFGKNREFDIVDDNPEDVVEIENIFQSDWNRQSYVPANPHLVISPVNARSVLTGLLFGAGETIDIEMEVIEDPEIIKMLEKKTKTQTVHIIIPEFSQLAANREEAIDLEENGVDVKTMGSPYIHAKLIVVDAEKAYVGSINFTTQSLDKNRELGIIIEQPDIVETLSADFATDWEKATDFTINNN